MPRGGGGPDRGATHPWQMLMWTAFTFACSVAVVFTLAHYALATRAGQERDQAAMEAVYARAAVREQVLSMLGYVSIGTTALALIVCVGLALVRKRYAAAVGAITVVAAANVTTQLLKDKAFVRPDYGNLTINSLPSGHTTVVASVTLAALLIAPMAARAFVSILGTFAVTLTGASTIVAGWHRPSDVFAGLAVSLAWGSLVVFVLGIRRPGRLPRAQWWPTFWSVVGAIGAGALLVLIGVRPMQGWQGLIDAALVLGSIGVVSAAVVGVFARLSSVHAR